jgi:lipopolysaccharide export LptBFGC system permease protein LptF
MLFAMGISMLDEVLAALIAAILMAAISVAMASPIQPRIGSRTIMRMNIKLRMC